MIRLAPRRAANCNATSALIWYLTRRARTEVPKLKPGDRLALVGDSLGVGLSPHLSRLASASGYPLTSATLTGSTMGYWLPRLNSILASNPTVVLVSLGTNDAYSRTSLPDLEAQLRQFLGQVQAAGARVVWIGPPTLPAAARAEVLKLLRRVPAYFHSEQLSIPQHDGIHSTADGYRDWAQEIWGDLT
jgi:lysophospholipase L1-like esterase